jgi:hydrogenase nickel incorporation protein HypA/HybF
MHEMSIAQNIVDIVIDTMRKHNGAEVQEVGVDIGELVAVVPESLEFCYNVLIEETPLAGSELKISVLPLMGICKNCTKEVHIENMIFLCPHCKSTNIEIFQGKELKISYLEVV